MRVIKFSHEPAQGQNPKNFRRAKLLIAVGTGLAEKRYGTSMEYPREVPISVIKDQLVLEVLAKFREDLLKQLLEVPISVVKDQLVRDVLAKFREDLLKQLLEVPFSVIKDQLVRDVLAKFREDLLQQL